MYKNHIDLSASSVPIRSSSNLQRHRRHHTSRSHQEQLEERSRHLRQPHRVAPHRAWGKLAEAAAKLAKGAHVEVEGELRHRRYQKEVAVARRPSLSISRSAEYRLPHLTKAKVSFSSSRLIRTRQLPSACRSFCFETTSSGRIPLSTVPAVSNLAWPDVRLTGTRRLSISRTFTSRQRRLPGARLAKKIEVVLWVFES